MFWKTQRPDRSGARQSVLWAVAISLCQIVFQQAEAASEIDAIRVWRAPDHTRIVLDLSDKASYKLFTLENPSRVVIDMQDTRLSTSLSDLDVKDTPVSRLRGAPQAGGAYRLVMDMQRPARPNAFTLPANQEYGDRLVIDLYDQSKPRIVKTTHQHLGKRDIVIAIDAGHGGEDPGATGPKRVREKNVVLSIARELKKLIDSTKGFRAVMIRDGDYYVGLRKRRDLAREAQADLFLSIHADAFRDKRVSGGSVFTLSQSGASSASAQFLADSENKSDRIGGVDLSNKDDLLTTVLLDLSMTATQESSREAAKAILQEMGHVSKLHKPSVEHAGFAVLKSPDIPSILVETGFISNPREAHRLSDPSHQKELAMAVFEGVIAYFNANAVEGTWVHWNRQNGGKPVNLASVREAKKYKVKYGDTLSGLALQHSVSVAELRRYNKLKSDSIRVGQVIKIPAS